MKRISNNYLFKSTIYKTKMTIAFLITFIIIALYVATVYFLHDD